MRIIIGGIARLVFFACAAIIVGNAVVNCFQDGNVGMGIAAIVALPITFFVYPFVVPESHTLWPFGDDVSMVAILVVALIAYPISTFVGGHDPVDW